ncbi:MULTISPECIES: branched-chain amino acid ABC transporter permease [unclassified Xanthobacter]|uniref:branched-chain amino acid ABC transporter permease n=1 Tax=unclassified Xanthobacter TaxID=2623496 RepID=UPI001EDD114F|nr:MULTISPECIES: branched-chain amino acid ABC transporter permease [unclassified Xanthobacter]
MSGLSLFQLLNGVTFAALLFIVASGFTLIFGLLRIVNLAHGALYLMGGYCGYAVASASGNFFVGALAAMVCVGLAGLALDRGLLRFVGGNELRQVLLTLGVAFVVNDLLLVVFGGDTFTVPTPDFLRGALHVGTMFYPKYRLFVLGLGIVLFCVLWLMLYRTRLGALIRAGVDDPETIQAMGINIRRIFLLTFMLGAALAGLGGAVGGAFLTLYPSADAEILVFSLAVVIIGGRGSLLGAAVGALMVGLLNSIGQVMFPEFAYFVIFGPMALILAFRPYGLFGRAA